MIDRLLYPDRKHVRGPAPGPFQAYRDYSPHLREEFRRKCVYCRIPDTSRGEIYEVDHYLPRKEFPHLATAWSNLFYACHTCNRWKGAFVRRPDLFIPNPCDDVMAKHLQFRGADIEAFTPSGKFMVEQLRLRKDVLREFRENLFQMLREKTEVREELLRDLAAYEEMAASKASAAERAPFEEAAAETRLRLRELGRQLAALTGEPVTDPDARDRQP